MVDDLEAIFGSSPLVAEIVNRGHVGQQIEPFDVAQMRRQLGQPVRRNHQAAAVQVGLLSQHCARQDVAVGKGCHDSFFAHAVVASYSNEDTVTPFASTSEIFSPSPPKAASVVQTMSPALDEVAPGPV